MMSRAATFNQFFEESCQLSRNSYRSSLFSVASGISFEEFWHSFWRVMVFEASWSVNSKKKFGTWVHKKDSWQELSLFSCVWNMAKIAMNVLDLPVKDFPFCCFFYKRTAGKSFTIVDAQKDCSIYRLNLFGGIVN